MEASPEPVCVSAARTYAPRLRRATSTALKAAYLGDSVTRSWATVFPVITLRRDADDRVVKGTDRAVSDISSKFCSVRNRLSRRLRSTVPSRGGTRPGGFTARRADPFSSGHVKKAHRVEAFHDQQRAGHAVIRRNDPRIVGPAASFRQCGSRSETRRARCLGCGSQAHPRNGAPRRASARSPRADAMTRGGRCVEHDVTCGGPSKATLQK